MDATDEQIDIIDNIEYYFTNGLPKNKDDDIHIVNLVGRTKLTKKSRGSSPIDARLRLTRDSFQPQFDLLFDRGENKKHRGLAGKLIVDRKNEKNPKAFLVLRVTKDYYKEYIESINQKMGGRK